MSEEISCPICFEIYDLPKVLNCGHSFCETCILPVIHQVSGKVTCPECRNSTTVPTNGLPTNFALNRLTEEMSGINLVTVIKSEMPPEMESSAKRIVWKAVNDKKDKPPSDMEIAIAQAITEKFKIKYGRSWQCIVIDKNIQSFGFSIHKEEYICLEALSSRIYLFKSVQDTPCWKCDSISCDGTICKFGEPQIVTENNARTKDQNMIDEAKRIALQALKEETDAYDAANFIKEHFNQKYGAYWACNIYKINGNAVTHIKGFDIRMKIGALAVDIFKPLQRDPCWKCDDDLCDGAKCEFGELEIDESVSGRTTDASMIEDAKRIVLQALKEETDAYDAANFIKEHFNQKYGAYWACNIYKINGRAVTYIIGLPIRMKIGVLTIEIFKPLQRDPCWKCDAIFCDGTKCNLSEPQIVENEPYRTQDVNMIEEAKRIVLQALKEKTTPFGAATFIKEHFNQKYGAYWVCNVFKIIGRAVTYIKGLFIRMEIGVLTIEIFKPLQRDPCWKCDAILCDGTKCNLSEPQIVETEPYRTQDVNMIEEAKRIVLQALKEKTTPFGAAIFIKEHFDQKYGKYWACNVSKIVGRAVNYIKGLAIRMEIGVLTIEIFKPLQRDPCWKCDAILCDGTKCNLSEPQIVETEPNDTLNIDMIEDAKRIVLQALKEKTTPFDAATFIKEHFNQKYGKYWACNVDKIDGISFTYIKGFFIKIKIGALTVDIFKPSQEDPCWKCDGVLCDGTKCKFGIPRIDESLDDRTKDETMIEEGKRIVLQTLKQKKSSNEMAFLIKKHFEQKYGGRWVCFIKKVGGSSCSFQSGFYIRMYIGKLTVYIFKPFQV